MSDLDAHDERLSRELRVGWFGTRRRSFWVARFALVRGLGFIHAVAFLICIQQLRPLIGERGLMPVPHFLQALRQQAGSGWEALWQAPSLFWLASSDAAMLSAAWLGLALSLLVLAGFANVPLLLALWVLAQSFINVGQTFWAYGWEMLLLEATLLAAFLVPLWDARPLPRRTPPPAPVMWLFWWLLLRLMFGAGLIKLRGDPCWTDLTCLLYHYETQPNPHPLSWLLHQAPAWFHKGGVLFNHLVELVAPFGLFGPAVVRHVAAGLIGLFQITLILSGNLSFLNWLTLILCLAAFDDSLARRWLPERWTRRLDDPPPDWDQSRPRRWATWGLVAVVALLSLNPVVNMVSSQQLMNASFDPLHLVNTYGAFGSVERERRVVVLEGTRAAEPTEQADWRAYEFPCHPGDPGRRPCLVTPYHYRLDWQMWFAGLSSHRHEPWIVHLVHKLLRADPLVRGLFLRDPFGDEPPRWVRAVYYRYRFTRPGEPGWWRRERIGLYLPPLSADDARLNRFLERYGWP